MTRRMTTCVGVLVTLVLAVGPAWGTNVAGDTTMSAIQGGVTGDFTIDFTASATLTMDQNGTSVSTISVQNGVNAVIAFGSGGNNYKLVFRDAAGVITLNGNATLTITGNDTDAGFDFATTAGSGGTARTLTITSSSADSLGDNVPANRLLLGRGNTVMFAASGGAADALDTVVIANNTSGVPTIDADADLAMATLTISNTGDDVDFNIADGMTVTVADALTLTSDSIVELIASGAGGTDSLAFTGGLTLGGSARLKFTNDTGRAMGTVTVGEDGATIDVNGNATIQTLAISHSATISLASGKRLSLAGQVSVGAGVILTLSGVADANAEELTLSGGMRLNGAGARLAVIGDSTTAMVLNGPITVGASGAVIDADVSAQVSSISVEDGTGGLELLVASGRTLTTTVQVNAATLKLSETGNPGQIQFAKAGAVLDVNASCSPSGVALNANGTIDVADALTLTTNVNVGSRTLTLSGNGTISQVTGTTGTVTVNGTGTITTLTANPGAAGTFTYGGTGASTVTTITAMDTNGEILAKAGAGTLTVTNGFGLASATGVQLQVNEGVFVDAGGQAMTFGDDAEKISVANGATYTSSSSITGHEGASTNFDAAAGSTVNFAKSGALTLTAAANDDFKLLGTVNVQNGCTVQVAGAFQSQFGSVNIKNTGSLVNTVPNSTMLFAPDATVALEGTTSGTLTVDGQATGTRITVGTTTNAGTFTIDRGSSANMTFKNVALSNCTYASDAGGFASAELELTGVIDNGSNTKWFGPLTADAGPDKTIDIGESTVLDGLATGGTGSYTYSWSPAAGLTDAAVPRPTASPTETTVYTLTVSDGQSTDTDTVTVTVRQALVANAGEDKTIPPGGSTTLDGSGSGGSGVYTFAWTPATGLDNVSSATPTASPAETTVYTLTVTDIGDGNETATDEVVVTVAELCGLGVCGAGTAPLLPVTLLGLLGWKWSLRRRAG